MANEVRILASLTVDLSTADPQPIDMSFGTAVVYPQVTCELIPEEQVAGVLEDIRGRILTT